VNLTVSQPIKIAALAGLVLIVLLGGATMMLGRTKTPPASTLPRVGAAAAQRRSVATTPKTTAQTPAAAATKAHATATPAKTSTTAKPAAHAKTTPPATAAAKTTTPAAAKHKAVTHHKTAAKHVAPRQRGNLVYADLPPPLQWQLSLHKVVVVSIYNPNTSVDSIAVAEAHQGAVDAGAGFLLVSVLDNKVAGILTGLLPGGGLLPAPGILVYRAPGTIALRIDGFADRLSVAQAAQNVMNGQTAPAPATTTPATSAAGAPVTPATLTP
jgi:hypothetical protein